MDDIDLAQANDEQFRRQALMAHFRRCEEEVDSMLDDFRVCRDCGEEIEPGRLEAKPDARRCIDCQSRKERRERHG